MFLLFYACNKIQINYLFSEIQWTPGQPDGERSQNYVVLRTLEKSFNDIHESFKACVSCEVEKSIVFTLRGVCEHSFWDDTEYFTTICGGFIGFFGNDISIW